MAIFFNYYTLKIWVLEPAGATEFNMLDPSWLVALFKSWTRCDCWAHVYECPRSWKENGEGITARPSFLGSDFSLSLSLYFSVSLRQGYMPYRKTKNINKQKWKQKKYGFWIQRSLGLISSFTLVILIFTIYKYFM